MNVDLILKNGKIITMDPKDSKQNWVAVKDQKIIAVGSGSDCPYRSDQEIDLEKRTVLPGLFDSHVHVMPTGLYLNAVNLSGAKNLEEVLRLLEEECKNSADNEWVFGVGYMTQFVSEQRYPTRWELDKISHGHPILIIAATFHGCAVNTLGLEVSGVPEGMAGVERDQDGRQTGVFLSDESSFLATANIFGQLSDDKLFGFIRDCSDFAVTQGVTSLIGLFGQFVKEDRDIRIFLENKDKFKLNIIPFYQTWDIKKIKDLNLPRIGGCLTLDGAGFEYTMALNEPYQDKPHARGMLYHLDDEIYRLISKAHAEGIQCALHALGDRAIDQLVYIFNQVISEQGKKDLRHRIEHFSLPTNKHIELAAELGLILSMQPAFSYLWDLPEGGAYEMLLGRERADKMEIFPEIVNRGGIICGGSDSPVTLINPLLGIASCINNPNPIRNVEVSEAIRMFTINAAYSVHLDQSKGSIEVGKDADFTVIDKNPYDFAESKELFDMHVVMTIKDGKILYQN